MTRKEITNSQEYKATNPALEWWYSHDLCPIEDATYWKEIQLSQLPRKEE